MKNSKAYEILSNQYSNGLNDEWDKSMIDYIKIVEDQLGVKSKDIQQVDEYSAEEDPIIENALNFLSNNFNATETLDTEDHILEYDSNLEVTRFQDLYDGFEAYQITKSSKI